MYDESTVRLDIALLRRYVLILLNECRGAKPNLLREQVKTVRSTGDLLKMRSALFECMCMHLGEAEAMDRIRSLDQSA